MPSDRIPHEIFILLVLLIAGCGPAMAELPSFVADAVQTAPGMEKRSGKLYVSRFGTRFEFTEREQPVVQVIMPARGSFRLLFPKTRTYFEVLAQPSGQIDGERPSAPCQSGGDLDCQRQGDEMLDGISVELWRVGQKGARQTASIWWDRARRMPLRQQFADGTATKAEKTGSMTFEGRLVEQWKLTMTPANGKELHSYMLFAPDLGLPVMEQGATGLVKELHNITLMAADPALYEVPEGYRRIDPPAARTQPQGQPQR